jgi:cytosine deaminase
VLIERVADAIALGGAGPRDLVLHEGHVTDGAAPVAAEGGAVLDAAGGAVLPGFVDAHVHLDKAFLLADAERDGPLAADLTAAIDAVARLRATVSLEQVRASARRAVDAMVASGTVAARVHVEIEPSTGLELVALHQELAEEVADRCLLQLVAFPQQGLATTEARRLLGAAMDAGLPVVGGCPYVDDDPAAHLDEVFALAEHHGAPVDLHLDFSDDPSRSLLRAVVERTVALGLQGRVTVGHATTLAALDPDRQRAALDQLAAAGIALVVLPFSDLHLAGHGEPGTRSVAPIERALAAGVRVAVATNNLANPFAPSGNGSLLHAAWLAAVVQRSGSAGARALLGTITSAPAAVLGLERHGTEPGDAAHLVLVDTPDPELAVARCPTVLATVRAGRLVHRAVGPVLHASTAGLDSMDRRS